MSKSTAIKELLDDISSLIGKPVRYVRSADKIVRVLSVSKLEQTITMKVGKGRKAVERVVNKNVVAIIAEARSSRQPFHLDTILAASGNYRSAIEAVLAALRDIYVVMLPSKQATAPPNISSAARTPRTGSIASAK